MSYSLLRLNRKAVFLRKILPAVAGRGEGDNSYPGALCFPNGRTISNDGKTEPILPGGEADQQSGRAARPSFHRCIPHRKEILIIQARNVADQPFPFCRINGAEHPVFQFILKPRRLGQFDQLNGLNLVELIPVVVVAAQVRSHYGAGATE